MYSGVEIIKKRKKKKKKPIPNENNPEGINLTLATRSAWGHEKRIV